MKKTIEQQVAELTPEQKGNMGKIYKKYITSIVCVVIIGVIAGLGMFIHTSSAEEKARDRYEYIETQLDINQMTGKYDFSLYDESMEALDEYYDMQQMKPLSLTVGAGVAFVGVVVVYFVFKKKYPYFSEKIYSYLKKTDNQ